MIVLTRITVFNSLLPFIFRFQMLSVQNKEKSLCSSFGVESQAPKRQKLEGGHLRKVQRLC